MDKNRIKKNNEIFLKTKNGEKRNFNRSNEYDQSSWYSCMVIPQFVQLIHTEKHKKSWMKKMTLLLSLASYQNLALCLIMNLIKIKNTDYY